MPRTLPSPETPAAPALRIHFANLAFSSLALSAFLGCGASRTTPVSPNSSVLTIHGHAHGGQQPVSGASIQLYTAGSAGNASAATPMLNATVLTDANGGFNITGDYTCPSSTAQVYITATGGNPGLPGSVNNPALALVAALGDCGSLASIPSISLNELTTAAAAWALSPFSSSVASVGASATNLRGLQNAMRNAMMLADSTSGAAPSPNLPANASTETAKLVALADILAGCVNSDGSGACSQLFSDASVSAPAPSNTFQAALAIVSNPAHNVASIFNDAPAQAAFSGALPTAPSDWTMSISFTGGGLNSPDALAIDAFGNPWVANYTGAVAAFFAQGTPMWVEGISGAGLSGSASIAIDASANIWVANTSNTGSPNTAGSVTKINSLGQILSLPYGFVSGLNAPSALAAAPSGNVWVGNLGQTSVSLLDPNGNPLSGPNGFAAGLLMRPAALALDAAGNAWVADLGSGKVDRIDSSGNLLIQRSCCVTPDSIALDANAAVWVGDSTNSTLTELLPDGTPVQTISGPHFSTSRSLTLDGNGHIFVVNMGSNSIAELADTTHGSAGQFLSPAAGFGLDARLNQPFGAAADASGNLWVTSAGDSRLVNFIGLAAPTQTPKTTLPAQP